MRRTLLVLATLGILGLAANRAMADDWHHGHHHGYYGWPQTTIVVPRPLIRPEVIVPAPVYAAPVYPSTVYPSVSPYGYYYPAPAAGVYVRTPGVSIGVGF